MLNDKPATEVKIQPDGAAPAPEPAPPIAQGQPLEKARAKIAKRYDRVLRNLEDFDANDITEVFLTSIAGLYDPHSTYFSPDTYEEFGITMRLLAKGQTNFLKMLWKFNDVYSVDRLMRDHEGQVTYPIGLPSV